jgi:hypothetical protein
MTIPLLVPRSCSVKRTYDLKLFGLVRGLPAFVSVPLCTKLPIYFADTAGPAEPVKENRQ